MGIVEAHYTKREVREEIAAFLCGRWAAVEGEGRRWARWDKARRRPLVICRPEDVPRVLAEFSAIKPRTFYGTIEVFGRLESPSDVEEGYEGNVKAVTVFIDVDIVDETRLSDAWRYVVEAARTITSWLEDEWGVRKSVYLLWSGAGMHIRIHEKAFNYDKLGVHPIDVAFAVAEYILEALEARLWSVVVESGGLVKIENLVAPKRVFTAPLSLHRRLDRVAVALKPSALDEFTPDWSLPNSYRHDPQAWRSHEPGEADGLAEEALRRVGRVKKRTLMEARAARIGLSEAVAPAPLPRPGEPREPGRFPVMALLQAARYYVLYGDLERAKSFGLNRAIFYAWAKYYGPAKRSRIHIASSGAQPQQARRASRRGGVEGEWRIVAGEKVQVSRDGWFVMGGVEQRPEDFDRQVARRFEEAGIPFEEAWRAALEYVKRFPRSVLTDPQRFYKEVYEPVRDRFVERVLRRSGGEATLDKWLRRKS